MRLVQILLGSANFGLQYGFANRFRQLSIASIEEMVCSALNGSFTGIDTAQAYGDAETILGSILEESRPSFILTKIDRIQSHTVSGFLNSFDQSVRRLRVKPDLVLFHSTDLLKQFSKSTVDELAGRLAELNVTLGVSTYDQNSIEYILKNFPSLRVFQVPLSILDHGSKFESFLKELNNAGYVIYARSIFVQGILLMDKSSLGGLLTARELRAIESFVALSNESKRSKLDLCLSYAIHTAPLSGVVIGADSLAQLKGIESAIQGSQPIHFFESSPKDESMFNLRESRFHEIFQ